MVLTKRALLIFGDLQRIRCWVQKHVSRMGGVIMSMGGSLRQKFLAVLNHRFTMADFLKVELLIALVLVFLLNCGYSFGPMTYAIDLVNMALFVISARKIGSSSQGTLLFDVAFTLFAAFCMCTSIVNFIAPQWVFWEALSFGRLFVWMYLFRVYWKLNDLTRVMNLLYRVQFLNAAMVMAQYFILHLRRDNIGGMFGVIAGCNAPLNMYLCIVCVWGLSGYLSKKVKFGSLITTLFSALLIAMAAELKVFFVELAILIPLGILYCRFSRKTVAAAVAITCIMVMGIQLLGQYDPTSFNIITNPEELLGYADMRGSGYGVSRVNVFSQLTDLFFNGDSAKQLFGMGFGSASQSSIALFTSDFYYANATLNYHYLVTAMLYLQVGYVGTLLYFMPFILLACTLMLKRRTLLAFDTAQSSCTAFVICIIFMLNLTYNNTAHSYLSALWAVGISLGLFALSCLAKSSLAAAKDSASKENHNA